MAIQKKPSLVPPSRGPLSAHTVDSQRKGNAPKPSTEKSNNAKQPNVATKSNTISSSTLNKPPIGHPGGPRILAGPPGPNEHMQERKRRLLEHRVKEEGRRAAVEEKRKQRLKEEKERVESAVRKTLEKRQRLQKTLAGQNTQGTARQEQCRRSPLTAWERNLVCRLLTPTCSYLARSRISCHSMNATTKTNHQAAATTTIHHNPPSPQQTGSPRQNGSPRQTRSPRQTQPPVPSSTGRPSKPRSVGVPQIKVEKQVREMDKKSKTGPNARKPPVNNTRAKPAPAKTNQTPSPTPEPQRTPRRSIRRLSSSVQPDLPSVPEEDFPVCVPAPSAPAPSGPAPSAPSGPALSPGNARPIILTEKRQQGVVEVPKCRPESLPRSDSSDESKTTRASSRTEPDSSGTQGTAAEAGPKPPEAASKPAGGGGGGGTTNREEALRLLAERRKEARLQREQEQQREREEEERRSHEEAELRRAEEAEQLRRAKERAHQRAEEQARLHLEAQRLVEEKRRREEEEHRRAEEERAQAMREAALLQKKRAEEEAAEREKADQVRREREVLAQREDAERQARKKKSVPARTAPTDGQPKENTEPVNHGNTGPVRLKPGQRGLSGIEDIVPVVAFKERRAIRTLTGLDEIQTHQRTEVI
ncbi:hypothetical protein CRUP_038028 [Coryphaenoides rupestris]|nr:hypothetical protein CRUP_038028 [Coryphaenoides rupestris]